MTLAPYKGSRDFYPATKRNLDYILTTWSQVALSYGFEAYDAPIVEPLGLYQLKSQTNQEIINNQIYHFRDRAGRDLALRPEMTPSLARLIVAKQSVLNYPLRWFSCPRLWRYEKPQRGRLREHWQFNADIVGVATISAELELISLIVDLMTAFGADLSMYRIHINSRSLMNLVLAEYFQLRPSQIKNLFNLIDRRVKLSDEDFIHQANAIFQVTDAPADSSRRLLDILQIDNLDQLPPPIKTSQPATELNSLVTSLRQTVTNIRLNLSIVRGFDYYTGPVFEVFDRATDNNRSLAGGGRYDDLIESLGGQPLPMVGFGLGDVTLANFLETNDLWPDLKTPIDLMVALIDISYAQANPLLKALRSEGLKVFVESTTRRVSKKINLATKKGIKQILFIGPTEIESKQFILKNLEIGSGNNRQFRAHYCPTTGRLR